MSILMIQNDLIVPVGQLSAFLDGHEVVHVWGESQRLQDLVAAPLPGVLVPLGGRATAYDDEVWPWLEAGHELTRRCVSTNVRILGVCLGTQLIAATFGGRISITDPSGPERGVIPLVWGTDDQAGGGGAIPLRMALTSTHTAFAGHSDAIMELPHSAREWARSGKYTQVFSHGTALGVQFRLEVMREIATIWAANNEDVDTEDIVAGYDTHEGDLASTCETLADWVSGVF